MIQILPTMMITEAKASNLLERRLQIQDPENPHAPPEQLQSQRPMWQRFNVGLLFNTDPSKSHELHERQQRRLKQV